MPDTTDRTGSLYPQSWSLPGSAERNAPPIACALAPLLASLSTSSPSLPSIDVLELASGFGIQLSHIAAQCPSARFWPSEADDRLRCEIDSTVSSFRSPTAEGTSPGNLQPAFVLEVDKQDHWRAAALRISKSQRIPIDGDEAQAIQGKPILAALISINLTHIAPWNVTRSLFAHVDLRMRYMAYKPRHQAQHQLQHTHTHNEAQETAEDGEMIERPLLDPLHGRVILYGPFKREGKFLSQGDEKFDSTIRARDAAFGLRDLEGDILPLARMHGWELDEVKDMPAGNFLVILRPIAR